MRDSTRDMRRIRLVGSSEDSSELPLGTPCPYNPHDLIAYGLRVSGYTRAGVPSLANQTGNQMLPIPEW